MDYETAMHLPKSAIVVYLFLQKHGRQPIHRIAQACRLSQSAVYAALRLFQIPGHDHDHQHRDQNEPSGNVETPSESPETSPQRDDCTITRLVAVGVWEAPARRLVATYGAERVNRQLAHHEARAAQGFTYRAHPAAYLYHAIVNDLPAPWSPPPGLVEASAHKAQEGGRNVSRVSQDPRPAVTGVTEPVVAPGAIEGPPLSREENAARMRALRAAMRRVG